MERLELEGATFGEMQLVWWLLTNSLKTLDDKFQKEKKNVVPICQKLI